MVRSSDAADHQEDPSGSRGALNNEDLYLDGRRFDELLDRLWVLDDDGAGMFGASLARTPYQDRSLRALIQQHVHKNPGDWSTENIFQEVGALDCSDTRFARFLEGLSSPDVRPDEVLRECFVEAVNKIATENWPDITSTVSGPLSLSVERGGKPHMSFFEAMFKGFRVSFPDR